VGEREALIVKVAPGHEACGERIAGFLRKLGHDVTVVSEAALEGAVTILLSNTGALGGE
jgi:transposase